MCARYPNAKLHLTGHSSGGVAAVLQAAHLAHEDFIGAVSCVGSITTFGQPRVGNGEFYDAFSQYFGQNYSRYVLAGDPIPSLPPGYNGAYTHGGALHHLMPAPRPDARLRQNIADAQGVDIRGRMQALNPLTHYYKVHSIGNYYRALLAPSGISPKRFIRHLYLDAAASLPANSNETASDSARFDNEATLFCSHLADVLHFNKEHIPATLFEKSISPIIATLNAAAQSDDVTLAETTLASHARSLELALASIHDPTEDIVPLKAFLRDIRFESTNEPLLSGTAQLIRSLDGLRNMELAVDVKENIRVFSQRLYHFFSEYQESASSSTEERIGFLAKHVSNLLRFPSITRPELEPAYEDAQKLHQLIAERKLSSERLNERY